MKQIMLTIMIIIVYIIYRKMNFKKIVWLFIITGVLILASAPAAAVAGSSMANDGCDTTPMPVNTSTSSCCESENCLTVCCGIPDTPSDNTVVSYLPAPNKDFVVFLHSSTESIEITFAFNKPFKHDTPQFCSFHIPGEYHCRSNLNSEDSFHI